jgi:hypothetical protein
MQLAVHRAGGLSEGITALEQLARLRLQYVVTDKLTDAVYRGPALSQALKTCMFGPNC